MNALNDWRKEKGDVYELVFCPAGYNDSYTNYDELNDYEFGIDGQDGFDKDINIFWTGQSVIGKVTQETVNNFKTKNIKSGETERRDPTFWLNWPVIDYTWKRMLLGKGEMLEAGVTNLAGLVTNPMQEAESSKVSLFAISDYAWNINDFDSDKSWEDSFKYISNVSDSLFELAKHMSDPSPNGQGSVLGESEELKAKLESFITLLKNGESIKESGEDLIKEYKKIIARGEDFLNNEDNITLLEELKPFVNSLIDLSNGTIKYIEILIDIENDNIENIWGKYSQGHVFDERSQSYSRPHISSGTTPIEPGSKRLVPFKDEILEYITPLVNGILNPQSYETTFITSRTDSGGKTSYAFDGDKSTMLTFKTPNSTQVGDYVGLKFSKTITLNDFAFFMGSSSNAQDTFAKAKVQITKDGKTWEDLDDTIYVRPTTQGDLASAEYSKDGLDVEILGIRLIATEAQTNMWLIVRDIQVNYSEKEEGELSPKVIKTDRYTVYGSYGDSNILDNDDSTYAWYDTGADDTSKVDDYIGLDLGEVIQLGKIKIVSGGEKDYWDSYDLEYSIDGVNYTKYASYTQNTTTKTIELDLSEENISARYVRIRNTKEKSTWVQISTFNVERAKQITSSDYVITNIENAQLTAERTKAKSILEYKALTVKPGEYIGIVLENIKDIESIENLSSLTLQVSKNNVEWFDVDSNSDIPDGRYVRLINKGESDVQIDAGNLPVISNEILPVTLLENTIGTVSNYSNAFDQERITKVQFQGSQIKGKYFIYDLGQTISLNSLKFVASDSEWDYPRHAKIYVSEDNSTWTEVMALGNQDGENPGEEDDKDDISYVLPNHEISYKTKEVTGLDLKARYVKFEITRTKTGSDKWIQFSEIELNGDEARKTYIDQTMTTSKENSDDKRKAYDKDLSTSFTPDKGEGSLTYNLSENTDKMNRLLILSSPSNISKAKLEVYVKDENGDFKWIDLGSLDNSYLEYDISKYPNILSVRISWDEGSEPTIYEILVDENKAQEVEKVNTYKVTFDSNGGTVINSVVVEEGVMISKPEDPIKEGYTFNGWYINGEKFNFYQGISEDITLTAKWTKDGTDVDEVDKKALEEKLKEAKAIDTSLYTEETVKVLEEEIAKAEEILEKSDATQKEVDSIFASLSKAITGLVEKPVDKSELEEKLKEAKAIDTSLYTEETVKVLKEEIAKAEAILLKEDATKEEVDSALRDLTSAIESLVVKPEEPIEENKENLQTTIEIAESIPTSAYTDESVKILKDALAKAKEVNEKEDATKEEIDKAIEDILSAIEGLEAKEVKPEEKVDKQALKAVIEDLEKLDLSGYTDESKEAFTKAIEDAKKILDDKEATQKEVNEQIVALIEAKNKLVEKEDEIETGWKEIDGTWYYYKEDGSMAKSEFLWLEVGADSGVFNYKFFNSKGESIDQFYEENGSTWLSKAGPTSTYVKGWWTDSESGLTYFFRETSGTRVSGWQYIDGAWRYFRTSGSMVTSRWEWLKVEGSDKYNWKFFNYKGESIDQFRSEGNNTWLSQAGPDTEYARGWKTLSGYTYFFRETSGTRVSGFQYIDGSWRYFRESGTLATGRQFIDGK